MNPVHATLSAQAAALRSSLEIGPEAIIAAYQESRSFAAALASAAEWSNRHAHPPESGAVARLALASRLASKARMDFLWKTATATLADLHPPQDFLQRRGTQPLNKAAVEELIHELRAAQNSLKEWMDGRAGLVTKIAETEARVLTRAAMLLTAAMGTLSLGATDPAHVSALQEQMAGVPELLSKIGITGDLPSSKTAGQLTELYLMFLSGMPAPVSLQPQDPEVSVTSTPSPTP